MKQIRKLYCAIGVSLLFLISCVATSSAATPAKSQQPETPVKINTSANVQSATYSTALKEAGEQPPTDGINSWISSRSSSFGSSYIDSSNVLHVQVVKGAQYANSSKTVMAAWSPSISNLVVDPVTNSAQALESVRSQIYSLVFSGQMPQINSFAVDVINNKVSVGISPSSYDSVAATLTTRFGALVETSQQGLSTLASTRTTDTAPWYGGDQINSPTNGCTSGFAAHGSNGNPYVITAGHCQSSSSWSVGSLHFGSTNAVTLTQGGSDVQRISVSSKEDVVYNGTSAGSTSHINFSGEETGAVGGLECFDGAVTFLNCSSKITVINECIHYAGGQYTCGLNNSVASECAVHEGDSGGPVYFPTNSSTVAASGMIDGMGNGDCTDVLWLPIAPTLAAAGVILG
jgi:hypothetical protein